MEIIDFKAGPQVATSTSNTVVRDVYGGLWTVLKNIGSASAQPREGAYYTRYTEPVPVTPVEPPYDCKSAIEALTKRVVELEKRPLMAADAVPFNTTDFYIEDNNGVKTIRKR